MRTIAQTMSKLDHFDIFPEFETLLYSLAHIFLPKEFFWSKPLDYAHQTKDLNAPKKILTFEIEYFKFKMSYLLPNISLLGVK